MVLALGSTAGPAAGGYPAYHPSPLTHLGDARQVVVVTASGWGTSWATLRGYTRRADGTWALTTAATTARVGWAGFAWAGNRRQGSGTTPAGTFRVESGFGSAANPGTALLYRRIDRADWWSLDPRDPHTYNLFQTSRASAARWRTSEAEHLWDYAAQQYRYAAVLGFNRPRTWGWSSVERQYVTRTPSDTRRGGAIFLHVRGSGATAGCVAVSEPAMRALLRWLDPGRHPRIVMGPVGVIGRV